MEITKSLRERFCKDNNIGIKIFEEPYFSNRLALYHRAMPAEHILEKWKSFLIYLGEFTCEKEYFDEYGRVKDAAIDAIKTNAAYQDFNNLDFNKNNIKYYLPYSEKDIYKEYNVGKVFMSLDMKKANFTALKSYNPDIFGTDTWEEFLQKFTPSTYLCSSKYIRQVIMGNCNPGRQITYEKYLMGKLLKNILKEYPEFESVVYSVKSDEIILDVTNWMSRGGIFPTLKNGTIFTQDIVNVFAKELSIDIRMEVFQIEKIDNFDGYRRIILTEGNRIQYKCMNSYTMPLALRQELQEEVCKNDKVFFFEGKLAKFL